MKFAELVESVDLPQTRVAERAWENARRRVRRRRGGLAAGAAALAVACVVSVVVTTRPEHRSSPSPAPAPTQTLERRKAPVVQPLLMGDNWRSELSDLDEHHFDGSGPVVPLSTHPMSRAAFASGDVDQEARVRVLGEDDQWRQVDVPGLVPAEHAPGYTNPIVMPTSLSPDATRLALPQPRGLVVVDLTTGTSRHIAVGSRFNSLVTWVDEAHVLVGDGYRNQTWVVDLGDGTARPSTYRPWTAFLGDTTLTWRLSPLRWGDGRVTHTIANNDGSGFTAPPKVHDGVVMGIMGVTRGDQGLPFETWGIVALNGHSGKVLAYLPVTHTMLTSSQVLGWVGDLPIIGVSLPQESSGLFVFTWDWREGSLHPIGHVPDWTSWGTGQVTE